MYKPWISVYRYVLFGSADINMQYVYVFISKSCIVRPSLFFLHRWFSHTFKITYVLLYFQSETRRYEYMTISARLCIPHLYPISILLHLGVFLQIGLELFAVLTSAVLYSCILSDCVYITYISLKSLQILFYRYSISILPSIGTVQNTFFLLQTFAGTYIFYLFWDFFICKL